MAMKAKDVMTTDVVTVGPETPVAEIAQRLIDRRISAVPVVDADGRPLGIVSEGDLMRRPEIEGQRPPRGGCRCSPTRRPRRQSTYGARAARRATR